MAELIVVPGVCQTVTTFHIGTHKGQLVWHWSNASEASWTVPQVQTLVNTIMTQHNTAWKEQMASNVTFNQVAGNDLSSTTPAVATSTVASFTCVGTGPVPPGVCIMVNFLVPARYKGGHPRTYLPGFESGALSTNEDTWITAAITAAQTGMQDIANGVAAALTGVFHCAIQWNYDVTVDPTTGKVTRKRVGVRDVLPIQGYNPSLPVRTQRRRITSAS